MSCNLTIGAGTATASNNIVPPGVTVYLTVGSNTHGSCIDQTGSVSNVVVLSGGSGLGTGFGSGGGSVTQGTSPWIVAGGGTAGTAATGVVTVQGIASMTPVQVSQATAASLNATVGGTGTCVTQSSQLTLQSGVATAVKGCDGHAFYDASDNGLKTLVAGVSAKKIYICGFVLATGGTATNLSLTSGTGSDCASTSTAITPAYQLVANDRTGANSPFWNGLATLTNADNLCVNASAGNAHQAEVWYTIQ